MEQEPHSTTPRVCSYEGSDYQDSFWETGTRRYEDAVEAVALQRLLNHPGKLMLELGAGAGRNTPRYADWRRVVLFRITRAPNWFKPASALATTNAMFTWRRISTSCRSWKGLLMALMIRTLHHMADPKLALENVRSVLAENAAFILEFANKRNLKAIARFLAGKQTWNPFDHDQVEFVELNFNFHPKEIRRLLKETGFTLQKQLAVSFFRSNWFKNHVPHDRLVKIDSALQALGARAQFTPSVFSRTIAHGSSPIPGENEFFRCPICGHPLPEAGSSQNCPGCGRTWEYRDGIYEFRIQPES